MTGNFNIIGRISRGEKYLFALVFFMQALFLFSSASYAGTFRFSAPVMGTDLELVASVDDEAIARHAFDAALSEFKRIESLMSEWRQDSELYLVNANAGKAPVKVSDELFKVIEAGQKVSVVSDGAFDITWAAMAGLWDFNKQEKIVPIGAEIKKRLLLVNYKDIELDYGKKTVFLKTKGMAIGLGGIAKGYAVDKAMEIVQKKGVKNAILRAGGDMRVQGAEDGRPWKIGIRDPRKKDLNFAALEIRDSSVSTSGDYERFFEKDGVLYHHIMDPRTGYPARLARSATVIGPDTMTTDALSTAVFVLGAEKGILLVEALDGIEAIIVDAEGRIRSSSGIGKPEK